MKHFVSKTVLYTFNLYENRKITDTEYRCFKNYEIEFSKGVNILIGKNGVGKTTLINSIKHAFPGKRSVNVSFPYSGD
ncbi:MAG: ATP-binding protein [Prevotella sp.]|nr:ATP-binding protein [Prevotella sp.]